MLAQIDCENNGFSCNFRWIDWTVKVDVDRIIMMIMIDKFKGDLINQISMQILWALCYQCSKIW